jgi:glycosyltransferase involved in cell wall biosynthesis
MARDPRLQVTVAFLSLRGVRPTHDEGFRVTVQWDIPLLDGYPWVEVTNLGSLLRLIRRERWTAIISYTGYRYSAFWAALAASRWRGTPYLFSTDAHRLEPRGGGRARGLLKRLLLPLIFRLADVAIVPSSASRDFLLGMGVDPHRVVVTPSAVDNEWWQACAAASNREATRAEWMVPPTAEVILFVAKLQPWKRPLELLAAFAALQSRPGAFLVFAGDGPLRESLERATVTAGVSDRVRILGFVNQSQLPAVYRAADVFVLPSAYEPFGLVVNEAMLCGCAVIVSDRVGAAPDLVLTGRTGIVYPSGETAALTAALSSVTGGSTLRSVLAEAGLRRVREWSPQSNVDAVVRAIDIAATSACPPS